MASGLDMMLQSVMRLTGIDPKTLAAKFEETQRTVLEIAVLLRAIYRQNALMMEQMGVHDDGRQVADQSLRVAGGVAAGQSEPVNDGDGGPGKNAG